MEESPCKYVHRMCTFTMKKNTSLQWRIQGIQWPGEVGYHNPLWTITHCWGFLSAHQILGSKSGWRLPWQEVDAKNTAIAEFSFYDIEEIRIIWIKLMEGKHTKPGTAVLLGLPCAYTFHFPHFSRTECPPPSVNCILDFLLVLLMLPFEILKYIRPADHFINHTLRFFFWQMVLEAGQPEQ